jgi:hypothetical protein
MHGSMGSGHAIGIAYGQGLWDAGMRHTQHVTRACSTRHSMRHKQHATRACSTRAFRQTQHATHGYAAHTACQAWQFACSQHQVMA